jgi:hypothetical protein
MSSPKKKHKLNDSIEIKYEYENEENYDPSAVRNIIGSSRGSPLKRKLTISTDNFSNDDIILENVFEENVMELIQANMYYDFNYFNFDF